MKINLSRNVHCTFGFRGFSKFFLSSIVDIRQHTRFLLLLGSSVVVPLGFSNEVLILLYRVCFDLISTFSKFVSNFWVLAFSFFSWFFIFFFFWWLGFFILLSWDYFRFQGSWMLLTILFISSLITKLQSRMKNYTH